MLTVDSFFRRVFAPRPTDMILYYLFFIIYSLLFILYYLFFIIYSLLFILYYLFFILSHPPPPAPLLP